ncbi:putative fungalysin metallopeptidase (M36) [Lyophyllum shimeji]|uniref:Fungalysin metallopeptidase (M36) n=1 Tax=Lyophyllum shimeji TaxID=47721 RepID=A0A9P3PQR8_LYOSH|nr:putative fungalysin metallopeptidase (M36) [Lyophyllum shimeji]
MSSKFFQAVLFSVLYASYANGVGSSSWSQDSTHRRLVSRDREVEVYTPPTTYRLDPDMCDAIAIDAFSIQTYGEGVDHVAVESPLANGDNLKSSTLAFVSSKLGVDRQTISYKSGYKSDVAQYAYVKQSHKNIPIANAVANVVFKDNKVTAFGSSFVDTKKIADSTPSIEAKAAIAKAEDALNGKYNNWPTSLEYVAKSDGSIALAHVVQVATVRLEHGTKHMSMLMTGPSSPLFRSDASYTVLSTRRLRFPFGWHGFSNGSQTTDTS